MMLQGNMVWYEDATQVANHTRIVLYSTKKRMPDPMYEWKTAPNGSKRLLTVKLNRTLSISNFQISARVALQGSIIVTGHCASLL
jgi:hypothetical protein